MVISWLRPVVLAGCVALGGCSLNQGGPVISDKVWLLNKNYQTDVPPPGAVAAQDYIPAACPQTDTDAKDFNASMINACIYAMLNLIDVKWGHFQDQLLNITSQTNFIADVGLMGIGAAGSFVSGGATQILHAASAGVAGLRSTINQDLLYSHTITTILLQMQEDRAAMRDKIQDKMTKPGYANIYEAANDLYNYSRAGSWTHALLSMQASALKSNGNTPDDIGKVNPSPASGGK